MEEIVSVSPDQLEHVISPCSRDDEQSIQAFVISERRFQRVRVIGLDRHGISLINRTIALVFRLAVLRARLASGHH
jgi:hypothetical protein